MEVLPTVRLLQRLCLLMFSPPSSAGCLKAGQLAAVRRTGLRLGLTTMARVTQTMTTSWSSATFRPYRFQAAWVDFGTALHCAFGTLAALIERGKSGRGQIVEGALLATALSFTNATLIEQAVIAANRVPTGNLGQTAAPADIYRTRDGWVLCQVTGQPLFVRWARLMGEEAHWLKDPRFSDDLKRGENGPLISQRMARWCAERTTQEAVDILGTAQIPAGPVLSPQQALDHPHIRAAGFMTSLDYPGLPSPAPIARAAVKLSLTPGEIVSRPPMLGEHTDLVLGELGYDAATIAALRESGAI